MPIPVNPNRSELDQTQIFQRSFDESTDRIRTDAVITGQFTGGLEVEINAADGDNIAISDGTNTLVINPDGSINVTPVESPGTVINSYAEILSLGSGSLTNINSYTTTGPGFLQVISVSGTNIATYEVSVNGSVIDKRRTYFGGSLNEYFDFSEYSKSGIPLLLGDIVRVKVIHSRTMAGDFNARLQLVQN